MPLKRLDIHGFKSFADKIEFQFNPGVTLVVGPNGSGKSNVADAIRWVLGEQSAKSLRGAKMEDIIFSGSDKRKPVGMAEVSMTLDNSNGMFPLDFSEITVTRRVYRSGESDYLINKAPCRLKDIHELITDTGIGKEGYSIIGQGRIDEILSTKSEDRRVLVEEAAGIVKYRNRKNEAVRKLVDTEQNLTRINDIIIELETQIEPLSQQAETAQQYLNYRDELAILEINLLINQLEEFKEKNTQAKEATEKLKLEVTSTETSLATFESKIEELRLLVNKLDEEVSLIQQNIYDLGSDIEKNESDIKLSEERTRSLNEQNNRTEKEITLLKEKLASLQSEFAEDENYLKELGQKTELLTNSLAEGNTQKEELDNQIISCQELTESAKGELIDLLNLIANKKNEIYNLDQEDVNSKKREQLLMSNLDSFKIDINNIDTKHAETNIKIIANENRMKEIDEQTKSFKSNRDDLNNWSAVTKQQAEEVLSQMQHNKSRHKILTEMQQHYEGFQKGVKEVLLAGRKNSINGLCGVVAELFKVPLLYETAIEIVLGGALQNLVTETDKDAKEAIKFLKKNNFGRATFLPLNSVNPTTPREEDKKAVKMPGAIGFALDLVSFDNKYQKIFTYLLGRTIVVNNVDEAVKIARDCHYKVRLVTLEGDVINPGGSMTGGSYNKKGSNLLGRAREIEDLEKAYKLLNEKSNELKAQQDIIIEKTDNITAELEKLQQEYQTINLDNTVLGKDLDQLVQERSRLNRELDVLTMEQNQLTNQLDNLKDKNFELKEQLLTLEKKNDDIKEIIDHGQKKILTLQEKANDLNDHVTSLKVNLAAVQQEKINQEQALEKFHKNRNEYQANIENKQREIEALIEKEKVLALEKEQLLLQLKKSVEIKNLLEKDLSQLKNNRQFNHLQLAETEILSKDTQKQLAKLQNDLRTAEIKEAKLEIEAENFSSKLFEDHGLSYEEALLQKTDIENRREVVSRIKDLKNLIGDLGIINIGSIEEYARVKERYDFLSGQYADLEKARLSLYKVIAEMDEIMVQRFKETFNIINKNFSEVFSQLFGGGKAQLLLTNPENLLETGVDIIAQPPGKKPQHLLLLSGGERALTAIAMLFGILKFKPSPFCVLDEIEASLDEANVSRFADFLKEFSSNTQFIVISHRKGTMEVADILYGVTIDETGVSKMVSMKFSGDQEKVS